MNSDAYIPYLSCAMRTVGRSEGGAGLESRGRLSAVPLLKGTVPQRSATFYQPTIG